MSPGPPAPLENDVGDPVEGTEKRTELASKLDTITLRNILCYVRRICKCRNLVTCSEA